MADKSWTHLTLKNGDRVKFIPPAAVTDAQLSIAQGGNVGYVDYTPLYENSVITLDVTECHYLEGDEYIYFPVVFSVVPKYENGEKVEGVKRIQAYRMGVSTAPITVSLSIIEMRVS